jgi:hypothetical protein
MRSIEQLQKDYPVQSLLKSFSKDEKGVYICTKDEAFQIVSNNGILFEHLPEIFRKDKEITMLAVSRHMRAIGYTSETLRNDLDIARIAIKNEGAFTWLPVHFKENEEIIKGYLEKHFEGVKNLFNSDTSRRLIVKILKEADKEYRFNCINSVKVQNSMHFLKNVDKEFFDMLINPLSDEDLLESRKLAKDDYMKQFLNDYFNKRISKVPLIEEPNKKKIVKKRKIIY